MQLVTTVYTIDTPKKTTSKKLPRGCREETTLSRGSTIVRNEEDDKNVAEALPFDGCLESEATDILSQKRVAFVVPAALSKDYKETYIKCEIYGVEMDSQLRIVVHQDARVLVEKKVKEEEIQRNEITLHIPVFEEGVMTFLLIEDQQETSTLLHHVPCCVLPRRVAQDVNDMFMTMIDHAQDDEDTIFSEILSIEQNRRLWVWMEYFCKFLSDIELLYEWLESEREQVDLVMDVFVNMLQHCCYYGAWELSAYLLGKAADCGLKIISNDLPTTGHITPEQLKAAIYPENTLKPENISENQSIVSDTIHTME